MLSKRLGFQAKLKLQRTLCCPGGLASTALVNMAFGLGNTYWWFMAFWGLNGVLQVSSS